MASTTLGRRRAAVNALVADVVRTLQLREDTPVARHGLLLAPIPPIYISLPPLHCIQTDRRVRERVTRALRAYEQLAPGYGATTHAVVWPGEEPGYYVACLQVFAPRAVVLDFTRTPRHHRHFNV